MRDYSLPICNSNQKWPQAAPFSFTFTKFSRLRHKRILDKWYQDYGLDPLDFNEIPRSSWIIQHNGAPLAMACLYEFKELSDVAMIGGLIADKQASAALKGQAIDSVIKYVEDKAKARGITALVAMTRLSAVKNRIIKQRYDIIDSGYTRLVKYLDRGEK